MKTWHLLTGGGLAATLAAVLFVQHQSARDELRQLASEVARLSAAKQEPLAVNESTPPTVVREVRVEVPAPSTPPPAPAVQQPSPLVAPAALRVSEERVGQRIQEYFSEERPDTAWARNAEHVAEDSVRAALPDRSLLRSVECHASLCRIETEHGDGELSNTFVRTAFMTPGRQVWNAAFLSMRDVDPADGKVVAVTYLAREGMELPMKMLLAPEDEDHDLGGPRALQ